ncbi:MAG: phosphotransferase [Capsulimonadales bacterium]|nr:phosphotransferase [Capsulimonadales bacterium]
MPPSPDSPRSDPPARRLWPTQIRYQERIEYPERCFADPELRAARVADRTPFDMPLPITGQFTNVYRMIGADGRAMAVRLFLRDDPHRTRHWQALTAHFRSLETLPPYLTVPDYQEDGFVIGEDRFPLVKLDWLPGISLNTYVEKRLYDSQALRRLAADWKSMMLDLENARFVHGDLQHGNVLAEEETGKLRLIDYDASYVPALARTPNRETGHPSYQHPRRSPSDYGPFADRFSSLVILTAIRTLAVAPQLWYRLDNGENLLFQKEDFTDPNGSRAFALIAETMRNHPEERHLATLLRNACPGLPSDAPPPDRY